MTPGELKILMALDKLADGLNNYKSIKGVFSIEYTPPPSTGYQTFSDIRSNNLDRFISNYESGFDGTNTYITLKVFANLLSDNQEAPFSYQFNSRDIDVIIGSGYDIVKPGAFAIKKLISSTTLPDDTLNLTIYAPTLETFGVDPVSGNMIGTVSFEIRFYNLVQYIP